MENGAAGQVAGGGPELDRGRLRGAERGQGDGDGDPGAEGSEQASVDEEATVDAVEETLERTHPRRLESPVPCPGRSSTGEPQAEAGAEVVDVLDEELSLVLAVLDELEDESLVLAAGEVELVEPRLSLR